MTQHWTVALQRLLLPPVCLLCGARGYGPDICRGCRGDLPANLNVCGRCAVPVVGRASGACVRCSGTPPPWREAFCAYRYEFPVDAMLKSLKFSGRLVHARLLGQLLALEMKRRRFARGARRPRYLVPVPLHQARERERGFNQAAEIAGHAARLLGLSVADDVCIRHRATPAQTHLDAAARKRNVSGAFSGSARVAGCHVAVVDDVMTTGATAGAVTEALLRGGARCVDVWAVARALGHNDNDAVA